MHYCTHHTQPYAFFLFPKNKSVLKRIKLEFIDVVKANVKELMNKLPEEICMEKCRDWKGEYSEGDDISIMVGTFLLCNLLNKKVLNINPFISYTNFI